MALNWNVSDVKDGVAWTKATPTWPEDAHESERDGEFMHPATDKLIWATMAIGMPTITEKNYLEFFSRITMYEAMMGKMGWHTEGSAKFWTGKDEHLGWVWREGDSWLSKVEVIRANIGLYTNATRETRAQFVGRITKRFKEDHERILLSRDKLEAAE
jgi:hypothetical protein